MTLGRDAATALVNALRAGTVPAEGLEHIAVGLEPLSAALAEQRAFVGRGHGGYRFLRGPYGAGKTFLASLAAAEALREGFVTSHVVVSVADTPLYRLSEIYRRTCQNLSLPGRRGGALQSLLDRWLYALEEQVVEVDGLDEEDPAFVDAVGRRVEQSLVSVGRQAGRLAACLAAYHRARFRQEFAEARGLLDWMAGEPKVSAQVKKVAGVTGQLDNSDALVFLRGLLEVMRAAGHRGLFLVLDEAETVLRMRGPERTRSLEVLRQLVDALDRGELVGLHLLVTGTPDFFDSPRGVRGLQPLHDRIHVEFREDAPDNLRQPQLRLRPFDRERLLAVARRVRDLYPATHPERLRRVSDEVLQALVDQVTGGFGGRVDVVPRFFLRELVNVLDLVDLHHDYEPARTYRFDAGAARSGLALRPEEEAALGSEAREVSL